MAEEGNIIVRRAKVNNLKDITVEIPRGKFVVVTGISGSGKSSLAFDTLFAEGQRRFAESLSSYARQFLGQMEKPDVDSIEGLSPAISIDQKTTSKNPRSTVGTITEIYDFLRLLYAKASVAYSPQTGKPMIRYTDEQIIRGLATAGIIGNLTKRNASISGAECGCQAEIGSACAMAAAALAELFGLSIDKIEYAAEIAIEHHLGLTCDPICGLVQIPCIERNAVAAMRAINAVNLANFLTDTRKISVDLIIKTMYETGRDISKTYKETTDGGLAKTALRILDLKNEQQPVVADKEFVGSAAIAISYLDNGNIILVCDDRTVITDQNGETLFNYSLILLFSDLKRIFSKNFILKT